MKQKRKNIATIARQNPCLVAKVLLVGVVDRVASLLHLDHRIWHQKPAKKKNKHPVKPAF